MVYSEQNIQSQKPCPHEGDRRVHYAPGCTGGQADKAAESSSTWHKIASSFLLVSAQEKQPGTAS